MVNARVFDKKIQYRKLCGGGHKIHSSDDAWETNKDLTLMFGLNTDDFLKKYSVSDIIERYEHDCIGVGGYNSINELFYVLNNTISYVVLRNFECLPNDYTVEGHGDIDLLVENRNYARYLTLARPVFEESYRVYHEIKIDGKLVPFDFRFVGDDYYDRPWESLMLKSRVLCKNLFYIPNDINLFYSLLYHAYVQKWRVKEDYVFKLESLAKCNSLLYHNDIACAISLLDSYLLKNSFEYIKPQDKTVVYNEDNLRYSSYAFRYGKFIKRVDEDGKNGYIYRSYVYEKNGSFIKRGSKWIIDNELRFLRDLKNYDNFPTILNVENDVLGERMEITRVKGLPFVDYFRNVNHQKKIFLISFIKQCVQILFVLNEKSIVHRDFIPQNLLIEEVDGKSFVSLIDFGWAMYSNDCNIQTPNDLGGNYYLKSKSDLYALASILIEYWNDVPYVRNIVTILIKIEHMNKQDELNLLKLVDVELNKSFTYIDEFRLFLHRHQRPRMILNFLKRIIKKCLRKKHLNII